MISDIIRTLVLQVYCLRWFSGYAKDDFDLTFDRTVQSFAEATLHQHLTDFTISFWVKVSSEDLESGTVLSYAVGDDGNLIHFQVPRKIFDRHPFRFDFLEIL